MFTDKVAVVTGGAKGIGKAIAKEFRKAGASVCIIDLLPNDYFVGDIADQAVLETFARKVIADYDHVNYLVNNALPLMKGIDTCSWEEFSYALQVGVTAPLLPDEVVYALLCTRCGCGKYLLFPGSYEPAANRKLYGCQRRYRGTDPRFGGKLFRQSTGKQHFPGLD